MVPRRGRVVEVGGPGFSRGLSRLKRFREDIYGCFLRRADALFELGDALLCAAGPVISPVELSVEPEFGRGHGSVYDALHAGRIDTSRLRRVLTGALTSPRAGEPLMFGIDVSPLPRPAARYADGLCMVQVRAVGGNQFVPGWPVSILVGLGWGGSSWVEPVDARRIGPGQDHAAVALGQVRALMEDLRASGRLTKRDVPPLVMFDSGYPATDLAYALAQAPVQVLVRVRSARVFYGTPGPRHPRGGRTPMHGARLACNDPSTWRVPDVSLTADSARYGHVRVGAWHAMHQALQRIAGFADYPADQDLPVVAGTLIHVQVERLPHAGPVKPLWLWHAAPPGHEPDIDLLWKAYLRRFDQEHFHRFAKVYLGLDAARLLSAEATDRWIALIMAGYAQLRHAAALVADQPRPWHKATAPGVLPTPCRTRAGFRRLRARLGTPAGMAKPTTPGPGRPPGRKNRPKTPIPVYRSPGRHPELIPHDGKPPP
jgi:hypothetical protein